MSGLFMYDTLHRVENRGCAMERISPLRASLDAFNKFKKLRNETKIGTDADKVNTNPFGITFKGTILQMDVFESAKKIAPKTNIFQDKIKDISKLTASAWTATLNKVDSFKTTVTDFARNIKEGATTFISRVSDTLNQDINFDYFTYNVSRLRKKPIGELEELFRTELKVMGA